MHKIIIILPNNLGDVIMALPVLEGIKQHQPDVHITFLVEEGYEGGLLHNRYCDRILRFPRKAIKQTSTTDQWKQGLTNLASIIESIQAEQFTTVINLSQHPYLSYLTTLIKASHMAGRYFLPEGNHTCDDRWSQYLYAVPFARRYNALHATDVYRRIADVFSQKVNTPLHLTKKEHDWAHQYLSRNNISFERPIAVLQPGAAWIAKRWPSDAFAQLGKKLITDGYQIIITGAPAERTVALSIAEKIGGQCLTTAGELTFRESIAMLPFVQFVVCGDTALMHAAAGIGKRVYALFGPTNPVETGPYGTGHTVIVGHCTSRPCFSVDCTTCTCMQSVAPDTVYGCIKGETIKTTDCSIFSTSIEGGLYRLEPLNVPTLSLFNEAGAARTRKAFEPDFQSEMVPKELPEYLQTHKFLRQCRVMEQMLEAFRNDRDPSRLRLFEQLRADPAMNEGINAFWTAVLNIRLNSVPLINPEAGLIGSIEACRMTRQQIETSLQK